MQDVLQVENFKRVILSKYILIDLEDTITIHNYNNRLESVMLKWLEFNQVTNPLKVYNNSDFKNRGTRLKLLGINEKKYEKPKKDLNNYKNKDKQTLKNIH